MRRALKPFSAVQGKAAGWLRCTRLFPDVQAGDRITGVSPARQAGALFWFNGQLRASVPDADFSRLFLGIWLSETHQRAPTAQRPAGRGRR
jgi:hypothetical protein